MTHTDPMVVKIGESAENQTNGGTGRVEASSETWASTPNKLKARFSAPSVELMPERIARLEELLAREKDLPAATMSNEKEFEDWLDAISRRLKEYVLPLSLFVRVWFRVASTRVRSLLDRVLEEVGYEVTHEELCDAFARLAFANSGYIYAVHGELMTPERTNSTESVWERMKVLLDRYERLRRRWSGRDFISDKTLCWVVRASVPTVVAQVVLPLPTESVWEYLSRCSEKQQDLQDLIPVQEVFMAERNEGRTDTTSLQRVVAYTEEPAASASKTVAACTACGGEHRRKDCRYATWKCYACDEVGHISRVCPNYAVKDNRGRVDFKTIKKRKGVVFEKRLDQTAEERLDTTAGDLEDMLAKYRIYRNKRQAARRVRREEEGLPTRDARSVLVAEEVDGPQEETFWEELLSVKDSKSDFE